MNNRGSLSLEGAAALLLSGLTLTLLLQIARSSAAHLWFDHVLYESLICMAEQQSQTFCQQKAYSTARKFPLGTHAIRLRLQKNGKNWQGELKWQGPFKLTGRLYQKLVLSQVAKTDLRSSACCF